MEKENLQSAFEVKTCVSDVIAAEKGRLKIKESDTVRGFAISGGGIRSASFGLGVMQALVANRQLEKMDYMSTVSGGGYLGSALTWALKQGGASAGTKPENFPLGARGKMARQDAGCEIDNKSGVVGNELLNFIRQHSSYLTPTGNLGIISFAGVVLRSVIISLVAYFCLLVVMMTVFELCSMFRISDVTVAVDKRIPILPMKGLFLFTAALCFALYALFVLFYWFRTWVNEESGRRKQYMGFIRGQVRIGYLWKIAIPCVLLGLLPYIADEGIKRVEAGWKMLLAGGSTTFGAIVGIWQYIKAQKNEKSSSMTSDLFIYLGAFALMYGLLLLAYFFSGIFFDAGRRSMPEPLYFIGFIGVTLLLNLVVNINLAGPHRIWRDRLMEAFMPGKNAVKENEWMPADEADGAFMKDMCDENNPKPYHIVNTNIILTNAAQITYRGRGGDNFILSPLYCGSEATGWQSTEAFQKKGGRGLTLASAMAASAAALNPNAGVSGEGVTRNAVVSVLLSTLNLRLGYWTVNPKNKRTLLPPNFIFPGLMSEIFGAGLNEHNPRILLSDGGHFENLALYELIRRKADVIVLSDGDADPGFNFDDLANVVEKARVDFDTKIEFDNDHGLDEVLPGTGGDCIFQKKYGIAKYGFAVATIHYSDGKKGKLFYIKPAMIEGLPTDIYSYKGVNPSFPHQSTADQFFDEKQFEAYRELGYYITWKMMESDPGKLEFPITA